MSIFYNTDFWLKPRSYEDGWPLDIVPVVKAAIQLVAKFEEGLRSSYYFRWEEEDKRVIHEKMRVLGALCYREPMNYRRDRSPVEEAIFDDILPYMRSTGLKLPFNVGEPLDRLDDELILYRENLQREREAITWPENTLQEHFMTAVASVKEGCFTEEHEPLFFAAAYARDAVFESWTPETLRGYFEAVEGIQTHEDYPKWVERANYELSEMDQPILTAETIEALKDELEIQSLWFKTTEGS